MVRVPVRALTQLALLGGTCIGRALIRLALLGTCQVRAQKQVAKNYE
jgi:hypothetical protein